MKLGLFLLLAVPLCPASEASLSEADAVRLGVEGAAIHSAAAHQLERLVIGHPRDLASRVKLLGYYGEQAGYSGVAQDALWRHVSWLIRNVPDSPILSLPYCQWRPFMKQSYYRAARDLWIAQVAKRGGEPAVILNAAGFVAGVEPNMAEQLLRYKQTAEPEDPVWPDALGRLLASQGKGGCDKEKSREALAQFEIAMQLSEVRETPYAAYRIAEVALDAGEYEKAQNYANAMLRKVEIAEAAPSSLGRHGNVIHDANIVLGKVALRLGRLDQAKQYLLKAGRAPGSPQLATFGPDTVLARELLERGETDTVLEYLRLCSQFWTMGRARTAEWSRIIKAGGVPRAM